MWLGYWNDYPDYQTEGHTFDDLKRMLISLRGDIREMIAEGTMPESTKNVGELAGVLQPVPRHREINENTARGIIRKLSRTRQ